MGCSTSTNVPMHVDKGPEAPTNVNAERALDARTVKKSDDSLSAESTSPPAISSPCVIPSNTTVSNDVKKKEQKDASSSSSTLAPEIENVKRVVKGVLPNANDFTVEQILAQVC